MRKHFYSLILVLSFCNVLLSQLPALPLANNLSDQDEATQKFIQEFHSRLNVIIQSSSENFISIKGKLTSPATEFTNDEWEATFVLLEAERAWIAATTDGYTYGTEFYYNTDREEAMTYYANLIALVESATLENCMLYEAEEKKSAAGEYVFYNYMWIANVFDHESDPFSGLTVQVRLIESVDINAQNEIVPFYKVLLFIS